MEAKKRGVLLVNLGTPKSFRHGDVFRYLNEFLTDGRVIDLPWLQRQALVRGIIVPRRYRQSAKLYQRLWTTEGSPLLVHGRAVERLLQEALGKEIRVVLAMRYQFPSISEGLQVLRKEGVEEMLIFPLFPQYASATTGSVHQKVMECLQSWSVIPKLIFVNSYFDHPAFIQAWCERAKQYVLSAYDHLLFSFHGLPERQIRAADAQGHCLMGQCCQTFRQHNIFCYRGQCDATARAIGEQLGLGEKDYTICFQSRLGKDPWIKPYTMDSLHHCLSKGYRRLLVFCPSFVCDCLETIDEVAYEYGHAFKQLGGEELQLVEGLDSHPAWIQALCSLIKEHF